MTALDDYGPFDSGVGANRTEDWWRDFFRHLTGSGVIDGIGSEFAVVERAAGANMSVDVGSGECFIRGHWGESTATKNVAIPAAHATLARIDRVVLRADFSADTLAVEVLEGTADASPAAPALTQSSSRWEISLAQVSVPAADTAIATAQITNERTILGYPSFDYSTAPADADAMVYEASTGLWGPGSSGSSVPANDMVEVATDETTTSASFTDLATVGPAVTVVTGTKALVILTADMFNETATAASAMAFVVSGASTLAASDSRSLYFASGSVNAVGRVSFAYIVEGLTAGSNVFTGKYRASGGIAHFANRRISVIDMGSV